MSWSAASRLDRLTLYAEAVKSPETLQAWTHMITFQSFRLPKTPEIFWQTMVAGIVKNCHLATMTQREEIEQGSVRAL